MAEFKVIIKEVPIGQIDENTGQIPYVPENPRRITDDAFRRIERPASGDGAGDEGYAPVQVDAWREVAGRDDSQRAYWYLQR